jgi:2-oxoglutarate dehydrogenase E2 component (dihydrolipoamide succinyltransferase)
MTKLRQTHRQRLVSAQHEAAMLTTFNEVDMSAVMDLRKKYQDDFVKKHGVKLGFMSLLHQGRRPRPPRCPRRQRPASTATPSSRTTTTTSASPSPPRRASWFRSSANCDALGMADIEKAIGEAAKSARDGKITLADLEGGVFTITNGGIFGSMLSTPILNAPQSAILGLHAINERPVAVNGQVVIRPMMYLALSYDHRLVDGKEAVTFLVKVKQAIEDPARLLDRRLTSLEFSGSFLEHLNRRCHFIYSGGRKRKINEN